MAARLVNLKVKNVAAVGKPANRRKWLIVKSSDATHEDKTADLNKMMLDVALNDDVEKAGKKISASRMAKLKSMHGLLGEIIAEQGDDEMADEKMDAPKLSKLGKGIAALFGRAVGADESVITELEKGDVPAPTSTEVALQKANDALQARLAAAEEEIKKSAAETAKLREETELRKFAEEVAGFKDVGLDPMKDATILKSVEEKIGKDAADRLREIFKSQLAQRNASRLMGEIGSAGEGEPADSAVAEIEKRASTLMSKNSEMTHDAALAEIFKNDAALYNRYRKEVSVKV